MFLNYKIKITFPRLSSQFFAQQFLKNLLSGDEKRGGKGTCRGWLGMCMEP